MPEVTIETYGDLLSDDDLYLQDSDALADALPTSDGRLAFWLPQWLAEEKVIEPAGQSDQVFVTEVVEDRETEKAYYVRQGNAGGWIPKSVARVYRAPAEADIVSPQASLVDSTERSA